MKKATIILFSTLFVFMFFTGFYAGVVIDGSTDLVEKNHDLFTNLILMILPVINLLAILYFNYCYVLKTHRLVRSYNKLISPTDESSSRLTYKDVMLFLFFLITLYLFYFFLSVTYLFFEI